MSFTPFTKQELHLAKKISIWGLSIVGLVMICSSLIHIIDIYISEGRFGLVKFVSQDVDANIGLDKKNIPQKPVEVSKPTVIQAEVPLRISIPSLAIDTHIESPGRVSVEKLDEALHRGPVYYDGSGYPGERNMLIFGHSTGFSIVRNQAFKIFNNLKNGVPGQLVYVQTKSGTHTYKITGVKKVSKYNTWIRFESQKPMLTLATCDSFGKATDRWVLEAEYVGLNM